MKISIKTDLERVMRELARDMPRAAQIAAQRALLTTARAVQDDEVKAMRSAFDRPTRWTLNSFRVAFDKPAMAARVEVKDGYWHRADNYLETQITGGGRKQKAFENALRRRGLLAQGWHVVPGQKAVLDAYGNMSVGQIKQILSWFDSAEPYAGSTQNMGQAGRDKRRKGTKKTRGFEYFAALPGQRTGARSWKHGRRQNLTPGIYKRTSFSFVGTGGGRASALEPVLIFVRSAAYRPRLDFYGVAEQTVRRVFEPEMRAALVREMEKRG